MHAGLARSRKRVALYHVWDVGIGRTLFKHGKHAGISLHATSECRRHPLYRSTPIRWLQADGSSIRLPWHLNEMFVRVNGEIHYLRRAVDHEGEVLEVFATKRRGRRAALRFLKRTMKRYGRPKVIVTDRLRSYGAAMNMIGNAAAQTCGRWLNNRVENSHQPFRRRERAMARFRDIKTLQGFAAAHASVHNHFNYERHRNCRDIFERRPSHLARRVPGNPQILSNIPYRTTGENDHDRGRPRPNRVPKPHTGRTCKVH